MKIQVVQETTACDFCGKWSFNTCLKCGKDLCSECAIKYGYYDLSSMYHQPEDGWYCLPCVAALTLDPDPLFLAWTELANLYKEKRAVFDKWYKEENKLRNKVTELKKRAME